MDAKDNDDTYSANFSWAVTGHLFSKFKAAKTGDQFQSDQFTAFDRVWRLECYPNGEDESSAGHISLYLRCVQQQQQQQQQNQHDVQLAVQLRVVDADAVFTEYQKQFASDSKCGNNQIAQLNHDWNTLTISAELLQTVYIDKGWFTWRLSSFVLDRFRTKPAKSSTSYKSPKQAIYGKNMHISYWPKSSLGASISNEAPRTKGLLFSTASFTAQCKQGDYTYHETDTENFSYLSMREGFDHSVFVNSDVVEIRFKCWHLIEIYPSHRLVSLNVAEIDTKALRIRDNRNHPAWALEMNSNEINLYMSTKNGETGNIYTKLECDAINLHDERVSVTTTTDESWRDELKTNSPIDALCKANQCEMWYTAKIVDVDEEKNKLKVHYDGWPTDDDEWIGKQDARIQPFKSMAIGSLESGGVAGDVGDVGYQHVATFEYDRNLVPNKSEISIKFVAKIVPPFVLDESVSLKRVREGKFTFDDGLYEQHMNTIAKWNEQTSKLQQLAARDDESILQPADDERENQVVAEFAELFSTKYMECLSILQTQSTRISQATDQYLLELADKQNTITVKLSFEHSSNITKK